MVAWADKKIEWGKSADLLAGLTLFFSSIFFFYDLFIGRFLLTERDLGPYFLPPRFFWVQSLKHGDFPLWNPYQFSGHPFFANPQYGILYPLNILFFMVPFDFAFNVIIVLHFFLGGLFTYLFLRDLKVSSTGALISGLIFMLGGYLLSVHSLLNCLLSVIWTPLIMMFFRKAMIRPVFRNQILTALFISVSFLGGGVEIVYGNFFVLLFMAIFLRQTDRIQAEGKTKEGPLRNSYFAGATFRSRLLTTSIGFRSLFIISILFLFLSAIQLIPFLELWGHSIRGKGISYQEATIWSFAPKDILLFFLPDAYGYFLDMKRYWVTQCWLKTLYTGGLPFVLSSVFFLFGRDRKLYLSLITLSLFLSLGQYNPLYPLVFKYVPFFNGIRYPVKFLYIFILIVSITAGLGFHRLTELSRESRHKNLKNLLILFSLISGLLLLFSILGHRSVEHFLRSRGVDFPHFNYLSVNLFHLKRFLFYLTLFFLLLRFGFEMKWKGWVKVLLIFCLIADLFGNMGFYGKEKSSDYFEKTEIAKIISKDKGYFRVFSTGRTTSMDTPILIGAPSPLAFLKEKHLPTMNLLYGLHDIWGIDVVRLKKVDDLYNILIGAPSISSTNLIDLYGIKYVISVTPLDGDRRLELVHAELKGLEGKREDLLNGNTIKLYRKKDVFPRAWLVKNYRVMEPNHILLKLKSKDFRPEREVLLEEKPSSFAPPLEGKGEGGGEVELVSETNNRVQLHVRAVENTFLVLSDTYFPGWKVYIDGKKEKIYQANYNFRAIPLHPGGHEVEFIYSPISFKVGAVITILTMMSCIGIGLMSSRLQRAAPAGNQLEI